MSMKQKKDRTVYEKKGIDPVTGKRKSYYGSTPEEAAAKASKSYGPKLDSDYSLHSFFAMAYAPTVVNTSYNWRKQIQWAYDGYIKPAFGHRDIREITRAELQAWFNKLPRLANNKQKRPLTPASVANIRIVFGSILNLAVKDEIITRAPTASVRLPAQRKAKRTALSFAELWNLLEVADARERPFIILAGFCGLRKSEACAVTRQTIKGGVLDVCQQIAYEKGKGFFVSRTLKTEESGRKIPLPAELLEILTGSSGSIYIVSDSDGGFITPKGALDRVFRSAIAKAELSITPHELRHTFISLLENELECPNPIVCALAGKTYQSNTAGYNHPKPAQLARWMDKFWAEAKRQGEAAKALKMA